MSASSSGRFISILTFASLGLPFPTYREAWLRSARVLYLQYHRHNQRPFLRVLRNVALQVGADLLFDHAIICALFVTGLAQRLDHHLPDFLHEPIFATGEAPSHDFGRNFNFPGDVMDSDN